MRFIRNPLIRFLLHLNCEALYPPNCGYGDVTGSTFKTGRTVRNYLPHLRKAFLLLAHSIYCPARASAEIAKGLRFSQRVPIKLPNFLFTHDIRSIINSLGRRSEFDQICFISYLFPLRVPSESLLMRRAFSDDRVGDCAPQVDKVLIAGRCWKSLDFLTFKMSWRKNLAGGCILMSHFLCTDANPNARGVFHPRAIWPIISERVSSGDLRFHALY